MADITKCIGTGCPVKEKCYRYTTKSSEFRQSWFCEIPLKDGKCDMFWGENAQSVFTQLQDILTPK
jgi:hypothetical protein